MPEKERLLASRSRVRRRALRRARGHHPRPRRLHARGARRRDPRGARHPDRGPPRAAGDALRRLQAARAARRRCWPSAPDVLLLDEPTNHLDILSIRWLEKFLADYEGCAVVISHDQRFLDNVSHPHPRRRLRDDHCSTPATTPPSWRRRTPSASARKPRSRAARRRSPTTRRSSSASAPRPPRRGRRRASSSRSRRSRSRSCRRRSRRDPTFQFSQERPSGRTCSRSRASPRRTATKRVLEDVVAARCGAASASRSSAPTASASRRCSRSRWASSRPTRGKVEWGHETHPGYFAQDHRELLGEPQARRSRAGCGTSVRASRSASCAASSGACSSPATT